MAKSRVTPGHPTLICRRVAARSPSFFHYTGRVIGSFGSSTSAASVTAATANPPVAQYAEDRHAEASELVGVFVRYNDGTVTEH